VYSHNNVVIKVTGYGMTVRVFHRDIGKFSLHILNCSEAYPLCTERDFHGINAKRIWTYHLTFIIKLGYGLYDRGSRVRFPTRSGNFSLHHRVQNGSGAHPASYPVGTRVSFSGGKVRRPGREANHSPPSSAKVKEWAELYLHSLNTLSWHGAQLKKARR
jgi:hypothetical protein